MPPLDIFESQLVAWIKEKEGRARPQDATGPKVEEAVHKSKEVAANGTR